MPPHQTHCARCATPIERDSWSMNRSQFHYCSPLCQREALREKTLVSVECAHCHAALRRSPSQVKRAKNQFCNPGCHDAYRLGKLHPERRTGAAVECAHCGATLYRQARRVAAIAHHFCGTFCHAEWQIGRYTDEESPQWRGGYSRIYGSSWRQARREARKRDNYTCQCCQVKEKPKGRQHDVHHIVPFRVYKIERHLEANQLTNLLTLCRTCHANAERGVIPFQPRLL